MFVNVGINWAGSLLVFFALALTLAPVLFTVYDPKLREKSKFASPPKPAGVEKAISEAETKRMGIDDFG